MLKKFKLTSINIINIGFIIICLFIFSGNISYLFDPRVYRVVITILSIILISLISYLGINYKNSIAKYNLTNISLWLLYLLVIFIQLVIITHLTFPTGWDSRVVMSISLTKHSDITDPILKQYLIMNPNNQFLAIYWKIIIYFHNLFNFKFDIHYTINVVTTIIFDYSVYCWYKYVEYMYNKKYAFITSSCILLFITLSGHIIITYSDIPSLSFSMIFAHILIKTWKEKENKKLYLNSIILGIIFIISLQFKPTTIIITGLLLLNLVYNNYKEDLKKIIIICALLLFSSATTLIILNNVYSNAFHTHSTENKKVYKKSVYHYLRLGLTESTMGGYSEYPELFYSKPVDLDNINKKWLKNRIENAGVSGLLSFVYKKWWYGANSPRFAAFMGSPDDHYYDVRFNKSDNFLTKISRFSINSSNIYLNVLWILIGLGMVFGSISFKSVGMFTYKLIIIGMFAYLSLLEFGRSRYMMIFFPYMLLLASYGWKQYLMFISNIFNKNKYKKSSNHEFD